MSRFRLHRSAEKEGREITFCCNSCVPDSTSTLQTFSHLTLNHLGFKQKDKAGYCSDCSATGFLGPRTTCRTCKGSGVCPECEGKPFRDWNALPSEDRRALARVRDAVLSRERTFSARARYFRSL